MNNVKYTPRNSNPLQGSNMNNVKNTPRNSNPLRSNMNNSIRYVYHHHHYYYHDTAPPMGAPLLQEASYQYGYDQRVHPYEHGNELFLPVPPMSHPSNMRSQHHQWQTQMNQQYNPNYSAMLAPPPMMPPFSTNRLSRSQRVALTKNKFTRPYGVRNSKQKTQKNKYEISSDVNPNRGQQFKIKPHVNMGNSSCTETLQNTPLEQMNLDNASAHLIDSFPSDSFPSDLSSITSSGSSRTPVKSLSSRQTDSPDSNIESQDRSNWGPQVLVDNYMGSNVFSTDDSTLALFGSPNNMKTTAGRVDFESLNNFLGDGLKTAKELFPEQLDESNQQDQKGVNDNHHQFSDCNSPLIQFGYFNQDDVQPSMKCETNGIERTVSNSSGLVEIYFGTERSGVDLNESLKSESDSFLSGVKSGDSESIELDALDDAHIESLNLSQLKMKIEFLKMKKKELKESSDQSSVSKQFRTVKHNLRKLDNQLNKVLKEIVEQKKTEFKETIQREIYLKVVSNQNLIIIKSFGELINLGVQFFKDMKSLPSFKERLCLKQVVAFINEEILKGSIHVYFKKDVTGIYKEKVDAGSRFKPTYRFFTSFSHNVTTSIQKPTNNILDKPACFPKIVAKERGELLVFECEINSSQYQSLVMYNNC